MSVKTRAVGKADAGTRLADNITKEISAEDSRESVYDLWDSSIMKKGDTGIQGILSYSSAFTVSSATDLAHKQYVDDAVAAVDLSAYLPLAGGIMSGVINMAGFSLTRVATITDSSNVLSSNFDIRTLYDNSGDAVASWISRSGGFGVTSTGPYTRFKTTNLSGSRDFELPNYNFAFPLSAPSAGDVFGYNGVNYVWVAGGGGSVTSVSGTTNRITSTGGATPVIDISASYVGQASITTVGTLTSGSTGSGFTVSLGTSTITGLLTGANGGTGVNNGSNTITIGGNVVFSGAFNATIAVPRTTTWTLPNTANETLAGLGTTQTFTTVQTFNNDLNIGTNAYVYDSLGTPQYRLALRCGTITPNQLRIGDGFSQVVIANFTPSGDTTVPGFVSATSFRASAGNYYSASGTGGGSGLGTHTHHISNGTAPAPSVTTDRHQYYSADIVAGNAAPHFRTEAGDIIKIHSIAGWGTPTGTLTRTTFATYAGATASALYTQAELQAVMNAVKASDERLAALISDLKTGHQLLKA